MPRAILRLGVLALFALAACQGKTTEETYHNPKVNEADPNSKDSVFGPGGLNILGGKKPDDGGAAGAGIGVNSFLWRASLDTVAFMPLASADPFGGVIITDWYAPPETPDERFKINIFILDRQLRADGLRAAVFHQKREAAGWTDTAVEQSTQTDLENAILTRARQLRINTTAAR